MHSHERHLHARTYTQIGTGPLQVTRPDSPAFKYTNTLGNIMGTPPPATSDYTFDACDVHGPCDGTCMWPAQLACINNCYVRGAQDRERLQ